MNNNAPRPEALITAAFVTQSRHEFSRAHAFLDKALAQQASSSQAWLSKASLHLVMAHSKLATEYWQHAREMARFYLDVDNNIEQAARLASINARLQREPENLKLLTRIHERAEAL